MIPIKLKNKSETFLKTNSHLLLLISALLWSSGGVLIKLVSWPALLVAGSRSFVAALCLIGYRKQFTGTKKEWFCALCYALCLATFVLATKLGPAANAIILQYSGPIYAAILGFLILGERIKKADYFLLPLALSGTALCFLDSVGGGSLLGNLFGMSSGFLFGLMVVLLKSMPNNSQGAILMGNVLASLLALPFLSEIDFSASNIAGIVTLGGLQIALAYVLFSTALKKVSAVEATMFSLLEPVLNPVWVALIIGEVPSFYTLIGGSIVLGVLVLRASVFRIQQPTSSQ